MKFAVISDVHGNVPALKAVLDDVAQWGADQLIVNGDLINRGPYSLACLEMIWDRFGGARFIKGNHEEYVLRSASEVPPAGEEFEITRFTRWTVAQMGPALSEIDVWPTHIDICDPAGGEVHVTHGSLLGMRDGIHPDTDEQALQGKIGDSSQLFIASHTHKPLVRDFNGTLVVNVGSVGAPFDGDPRACYGRFAFTEHRWHTEIARVPFDRHRAEQDFRDSGLLDEGGPLVRLMLEELRRSRMLVGHWMREWHPRVIAGEIDANGAVDRFLQEAGTA